MKLTVVALALLVAGASYVDMAAAKHCFHGSKAQEKCDKYVSKHWGTKCEAMGFGKAEVCAVPLSGPPAPPVPPTPHDGCFHGAKAKKECNKYVAKHLGLKCQPTGLGKNVDYCPIPNVGPPAPIPSPPTPSVKVDDLPLYKATHNQLGLGSCQYKTKHGVNHSAKCTGVDKHEGGLEVPVQYQVKNLDKPEKMQEQIHFHGKAKGDSAKMNQPLQVNGGGKVKYQANHDAVKGEGKEKVVRRPGSTAGSTKPIKEKVTYECSGGKTGIKCGWSDKA